MIEDFDGRVSGAGVYTPAQVGQEVFRRWGTHPGANGPRSMHPGASEPGRIQGVCIWICQRCSCFGRRYQGSWGVLLGQLMAISR